MMNDMTGRRTLKQVGSVVCLWSVLVGAQQIVPAPPGPRDYSAEIDKQLRRFATVFGAIEENYADPLNQDGIVYRAAIPGMLRTLDPYTVFFDPDQFHQLQQQQRSKVEGFGTIVTVMPGRVIVLEVHVGSPAARAGIQPGDELLEINGYRIELLTVEQLPELLGEAKKAKAQVRLRHPGSAALQTAVITPAEMSESSVDRNYFIEPGIGYVRLNGFENTSADELHAAIAALLKQGMRALVFDMRENHGGLVDSSVEIAGFFLPANTVVLSVRGRSQKDKIYKVAEDAKPWDFPMAVLVGKNTASAAEILSGALQDHHRAKLIGTQTYGKGIVQSVYTLSEGTGVALAAAQYFTPAGRTIQKPTPGLSFTKAIKGPGGIAPDEIVAGGTVANEYQMYLENGNALLDFARLWVPQNREGITDKFEVTPELLDAFKSWLQRQNAMVTDQLWSGNRTYLRQRLKVEIFNLAFGVAKGDQV